MSINEQDAGVLKQSTITEIDRATGQRRTHPAFVDAKEASEELSWVLKMANRGITKRYHPKTGEAVIMIKSEVGRYYSEWGTPVSEDMARQAGFDVDRYAAERRKSESYARMYAELKARHDEEVALMEAEAKAKAEQEAKAKPFPFTVAVPAGPSPRVHPPNYAELVGRSKAKTVPLGDCPGRC